MSIGQYGFIALASTIAFGVLLASLAGDLSLRAI
jgi:hypothetical protein